MIATYVLGKRSYLSKNIKKKNSKFKLMSVKEMFGEVNYINNKKINIIYNHSYPLSKLNNLNDYSKIIRSNIYLIDELIKLLQKKKVKINSFIFTSSSSVIARGFSKKIACLPASAAEIKIEACVSCRVATKITSGCLRSSKSDTDDVWQLRPTARA